MSLRVMTYNILQGGDDRLPYIRDVIRAQAPDIVAIQEANDRERAEILARELEMRLIYGEANSPYSLAWLSALPITRSENHRLPELRKTLLEIEVGWEGRPLRLFNIHLMANPESEQQRMGEMEAVLRAIGPAGNDHRLFIGDFNSISPADSFVNNAEFPDEDITFAERAYPLPRLVIPSVLSAGYVDIFRAQRPGESGYTAKTPTPIVRIDYIFASPSMADRAVSCSLVDGALPVYASDHLPVRADFE